MPFFHYNVHQCKNVPRVVEALLNKHADKGYEPYYTRNLGNDLMVFFRRPFKTADERDAYRKTRRAPEATTASVESTVPVEAVA